jgi:hypothetical protein
MNQHRPDLAKRLLFILHRGLVQARNLALCEGNQQLADLADALEILPGLIDDWKDGHLELVRAILKTYQEKYPGSPYDYLAELESDATPTRF